MTWVTNANDPIPYVLLVLQHFNLRPLVNIEAQWWRCNYQSFTRRTSAVDAYFYCLNLWVVSNECQVPHLRQLSLCSLVGSIVPWSSGYAHSAGLAQVFMPLFASLAAGFVYQITLDARQSFAVEDNDPFITYSPGVRSEIMRPLDIGGRQRPSLDLGPTLLSVSFSLGPSASTSKIAIRPSTLMVEAVHSAPVWTFATRLGEHVAVVDRCRCSTFHWTVTSSSPFVFHFHLTGFALAPFPHFVFPTYF
ncbi:hypothetical protein BJ165DRAFT_1409216 [Panaeolus papilionaceus]|nr:hypothetical protein BJ165DRAFT_1409216 [Panaeolus papilionaceus]